VDLHVHLIPGVDDGPATREETLAILAEAHAQGTRFMVATPHMYSPLFANDDPLPIHEAYSALVDWLVKLAHSPRHAFLRDMQVGLGAENHVSEPMLAALRQGKVLTLGDSDHLLLELPPMLPLRTAVAAIEQVVAAGLAPIVAHVERVEAVRRDSHAATALLEAGAYLQVNAQSLRGWPGTPLRGLCMELLEAGFVALVASDAHNCTDRPPGLHWCYQVLARRFPESDVRRWMESNPARMLRIGAATAADGVESEGR
jgi:protein-tyrosine phosphatase